MGGWHLFSESYFRLLLLGCCTLIDQIDNAHVRNARIRLQTYLAGTAVRIAHLNVVGLDLRAELA